MSHYEHLLLLTSTGQSLLHPLELTTGIRTTGVVVMVVNVGVEDQEPPDTVLGDVECLGVVAALVEGEASVGDVDVVSECSLTPQFLIIFTILTPSHRELIRRRSIVFILNIGSNEGLAMA